MHLQTVIEGSADLLGTDIAISAGIAAEAPFVLEYDAEILDGIREPVISAFFSLPGGGVEVGGLLLGRYASGRLTITDSIPFLSEHAFGPSYVLSEKDQRHLGDMIAAARLDPATKPVGWYRSKTRGGIDVSAGDLEIHNQFFAEPWQLLLIVRPEVFLPTRAAFFFRAADGTLQPDSTHGEFELAAPAPTDEKAARAADPQPEANSAPAIVPTLPVPTREETWTSKLGGWFRPSNAPANGSVQLKRENARLRGDLLRQTESNRRLEGEITDLHAENVRLAATHVLDSEAIEEQKVRLDAALTRHCELNSRFEKEIAELHCENARLQESIAQTEAENHRMREEAVTLREHAGMLQSALEFTSRTQTELREQNVQLDAALALATERSNRIELECAPLRENYSTLESALASANDRLAACGAENARLQATLAQEKERNNRSSRDLNDLRIAWLNDVRLKAR